MADIRQDSESLRRELNTRFKPIVRYLRLAGLSTDQIKREMHAAVERTVQEEGPEVFA
jgi:hypothetical protein